MCFLVDSAAFFAVVCVCVCPCDMVCSRLKLKPDAFVDMGFRLGSKKHVLVSVVVQMTDSLVISLACCPEFTVTGFGHSMES